MATAKQKAAQDKFKAMIAKKNGSKPAVKGKPSKKDIKKDTKKKK
jgi:hypothetical protein